MRIQGELALPLNLHLLRETQSSNIFQARVSTFLLVRLLIKPWLYNITMKKNKTVKSGQWCLLKFFNVMFLTSLILITFDLLPCFACFNVLTVIIFRNYIWMENMHLFKRKYHWSNVPWAVFELESVYF